MLCRALTACALAVLLIQEPLYAQSGIAPPTRTLAITGANVVPAPGQLLEGATVVIRDGLITAVGTDVEVPYDARVIDVDSMFVYAGFIDPVSHIGMEPPRPNQGGAQGQQQAVDRDNPPFERAGIQPDRSPRGLINAEHKSVADMRKSGFTAAHTVPYGRMIPGAGAVIVLQGDGADDMIVANDVSMFVQFQGAQGVAPGTPMAMTAKMRQLYREAERRHGLAALYEDDPAGMSRPPYDPVHSAFFPVIEGDRPVFFHVTDALQAHRALKLREDLGFRLVLTGLPTGYDLAGKLATSGVPLAVTTELPDKPKWMAKLERDSLLTIMDNYDPDFRTATWRDTEAEIRVLEAKQAIAREDYVGNAAALHDAGASFAFTSIDTKPDDILPNIRAMLAAGLDTTAALAALTTNAADMIGMSRAMGTVERGKLGNLVITSAPLFDDESAIRHVVVEGQVYDIEEKKPAGPGSDENVTLVGGWTFVAETPEGDIPGTFDVSGSPGSYEGSLAYEGAPGAIPISDIEVDGDEVSFSFASPQGFITISLTWSGDSMSGTATVDGEDTVPITMDRSPQ